MGLIFDVKQYSIHDGPGIRTTIFFKGCPLKCPWCHNPESKLLGIEMMWMHDRCINCGACVEACKNNAIIQKNSLEIDITKCTLCKSCVNECYSEALKHVGMKKTVDEILEVILKDQIFYEESGGGVTFSGGEPLLQPEFLKEILTRCKKIKIHTAVDTSGFARPDVIESIKDLVDLWLFDLKHMNSKKHLEVIGASNELILENLGFLDGNKVWIRMPVILGFNDDIENINKTVNFMKKHGIKKINLLPYHKVGLEKVSRLINHKASANIYSVPSSEDIENISDVFRSQGIEVKIGG